MKIRLASRGGWTAGMRLPPLVVDTNALPAAAASLAKQLAAAAEDTKEDLAAGAAAKARAPEAMTYEITLEYGDREVTLKGSDVASSPQFEALRAWVQNKAIEQQRKPD